MLKYVFTGLGLVVSFLSFGQSPGQDSLRLFNQLDSAFNINYQSDPAVAITTVERLDKIAEYLGDDSLKVKKTADHARVMRVLGFTDIAMEDFFVGLHLAEKLTNPALIARLNYEIAVTYQNQLGDYGSAISHIHEAYNVAVANGIFEDTTFYNYCLAENLVFAGHVEKGVQLLQDNVANAKKTDRYMMILGGLETLSFIYFKIGQNDRSLEYSRATLPFLPRVNDNYQYLVDYIHIAEMSVVVNQWDSAARYVKMAKKYARLVNSADWYYELYKQEANLCYHNGDYKGALKADARSSRYKDSVFQKSYQNKIAALTANYSLEKKQAEIEMLRKDNALRAATIGQQKMERNATMLASSLLLVVVVTSFRGWMNRKTRGLRETFSRELIRNQEADRQRIAREMHDSIGQNILFIRNQVAAGPEDAGKARLMETIESTMEEVRNIAKDLYPNQLDRYGLDAAVAALAEKTSEVTGVFVSADTGAIDALLNAEAKINCYRIIQECISNAVKHAHAKAIRIEGSVQKNKLVLVVKDNGRGFEPSVIAHKAQSSFGLLGMEERARMLGGKMDIASTSGGTTVTITFPVTGHAV